MLRKMKKLGSMFQIRARQETNMNEIEVCDLPDGEFKITVIKMLTRVRKSNFSLS